MSIPRMRTVPEAFRELKKADPDTTLAPEDRQIGGLGIFLVKKTMDGIDYERRQDCNVVRIYKNL